MAQVRVTRGTVTVSDSTASLSEVANAVRDLWVATQLKDCNCQRRRPTVVPMPPAN